MDEMKQVDFLHFPFMTQEEINFILLDPSKEKISSPQSKNNLRTEMVDILKQDRTGILLLPFGKKDI
jgi:hypothetical protein